MVLRENMARLISSTVFKPSDAPFMRRKGEANTESRKAMKWVSALTGSLALKDGISCAFGSIMFIVI